MGIGLIYAAMALRTGPSTPSPFLSRAGVIFSLKHGNAASRRVFRHSNQLASLELDLKTHLGHLLWPCSRVPLHGILPDPSIHRVFPSTYVKNL